MADTAYSQLPPVPRVTHPETKPATEVTAVETAADFRAFQAVARHVYWADPYYVPPLAKAERALFDRATNPFFRRGDARLFLAWHGHGQPVGRVAAFRDRDYDAATGKRWGFFGLLEFMNDARLPEALLAEAATWLRQQGAEEIAGPVAFSAASPEHRGLLLDGFYDDPVFQAAYNPPAYAGFVARLGVEKWFDEWGYELDTSAPPPERLAARAKEVAAQGGLSVRPLDLARFDEEWEMLRALEIETSRGLPRFVPEAREDRDRRKRLVRALIRILPEGALVLEEKGEPAGFALALVDYNRVLKHVNGSLFPLGWLKAALLRRTIDRARLAGFGVLGAGRARALPLAHALWAALHARRYARLHVLAVPEDGERATRLLEGLGAKRTRAWRIFKLPADFPRERTPHRPG